MKIKGSRVLITGASRGIGEAMARSFADAGADVIVLARSAAPIEALAAEVGGHSVAADLGNATELDGLVASIEAERGPIDILVNNAGIESAQLVDELDEGFIQQLNAVNVIAPQRLTRQVLPGMLARGTGHIVFTSSVAGSTPSPGLAIYCASKAGLTRFSEALRIELRKTGIGVTTLHLGPVETGMWERVTENPAFDATQARFRRLGLLADVTPERVADDTIRAIETNRREIRHPKRLTGSMAIAAAPGRITEALLTGIVPREC